VHYRYTKAREKEIKKLEKPKTENLTVDCVGRKINMMKTVYSQEVKENLKSK
jgi:hypothetical protein